jgi:serine protease Do
VLVSNVRKGSAAEKAGVKRNDVITAINGEKIEDSNVLRNKVAGTLPGTEVKLSILRDGKEVELTATLDEFELADSDRQGREQEPSDGPAPQNQSGKLGLSLEPLNAQTARRYGLEGETEGLVVTSVEQDGPAAEAGIAQGDVILEVNRRPVSSVEDVRSALDAAGSRTALLLITRRGQTVYVPVRPQ